MSAPESPTIFDVVKELEESTLVDEALDLSEHGRSAIDADEVKVVEEHRHIKQFYQNKTVLLTGATGFIGKAVLWKLLQSCQGVQKIYLLLRQAPRQQQRKGRLHEDILSNKAFASLRRSMGAQLFDDLIEKVIAVYGDLTEENLGLSAEDMELLTKEVDIIFHCAGNVDGNENLLNSVKTNTLGTLHLFDLASKCQQINAFIHLSNLQQVADEKHLYPLPSNSYQLLDTILAGEPVEYRTLYNNPYLFAKSLTEHVIVDQVTKKKQEGKAQFPVAMMRLAPVGPSVQEPLIGWADGVNGMNGTILLTGKGQKAIQPHVGDGLADIVPVDYVARLMIGSAATLSVHPSYTIPQVLDPLAAPNPSERMHKRTSSTASSRISNIRSSTMFQQTTTPQYHHQLPAIFQLSIAHMRPVTWRNGYEAIRQYWNKHTNAQLPPSMVYFGSATPQRHSSSSTNSLSRARTVMNSLRGYYSSGSTPESPVPSITVSPSVSTDRKRQSHRLSRAVDKAAKLQHTITMFSSAASSVVDNTTHLSMAVRDLDIGMEFDPHVIVPEDADTTFWFNYFTNASYGIHYFVCQETYLRLPTPIYGWSCAIAAQDDDDNYQHVFGTHVKSALFSQDQINQRTARMVSHIKQVLLMHDEQQTQDDAWLTDLDDALDDWCQDTEIVTEDRRMALGKWRRKVGSNDESVKVIVLNDKRVNQAIHSITQNAGVPKQTAVNEAMKILVRMSERTQLAFVWFTGNFLKALLEDIFEQVRISDESLKMMKQATMGKRVVYVPVSKSMLDPLLVWYIAIRYHLPVPALACDESMSQMGPISDVYRLAGAYYVKRDKSKRSPLNSAVTAAYTQVLLREHGALAFCMERSRSRTGKCQEAYADGFVEMILEATLQTNQTAANGASTMRNTPPDSPAESSSPTMSIDSLAFTSPTPARKVHKDVVFVPIHITYENVPELSHLIDQVLDQQPRSGRPRSASQSRPLRPSETKDRRKMEEALPKKCGRVTFGVGPLISVQEVAQELNRHSNDSGNDTELVQTIMCRIHESQCHGLIVSPVSIVASIILYGRATHGVCVGKIKELMEWLRYEIVSNGYTVDWQEGEDLDSLILTAFQLLNEPKNLIVDGREINDDTNIRVNDHADNVMALSYYGNQMIDIFLLDSFFAIVYLSFLEESVLEDEFMDRFRFLLQLLEREFVLTWQLEDKFEAIVNSHVRKQMVKVRDNRLVLLVNMENDPARYEQLIFLASLVYPTVDAYWITSCSLSALEVVPMLPRCIVPLLTQWIATHLITSRRTIYREVLSTESSKTAVDVFMSMGFLTEIQAKEKLSPDAQILLHELGIPTSEILIELAGQNSDGGKTPVTPTDPEAMMKAVMAQIQMNRANSNMADLCQQIDSYRLGAATQRESFQNAQVFQKCLKQIKGILQANSSFSVSKKRKVELPEEEDGLVQLVYSLLASSVPAGDRAAQARALRRISEAYNLR